MGQIEVPGLNLPVEIAGDTPTPDEARTILRAVQASAGQEPGQTQASPGRFPARSQIENLGLPRPAPGDFSSLQELGGMIAETGVEAFSQGINVSATDVLDIPGELTAAGLRALGMDVEAGGVRKGAAALGLTPPPGVEPLGRAGAAGRMVGGAVQALIPVIGIGGRIKEATTVAGKIVKEIAESAFKNPKRFFALEAASAVSAGVAGFETAKRFPDSEVAQVMGELVGGLTPGALVATAKVLPTVLGAKVARRIVEPFRTTGGQRRARARVQRAVEDPEAAVRTIDGPEDTSGGFLPSAALTPAQKIGERELLSLEKSVIESSAALRIQSDDQIANANKVIREALLATGTAPVSKTREVLEEARGYLAGLLETRLKIAMRRADERLIKLGPTANRETANRLGRAELDKALKAARAQETELWLAIPERTRISLAETRNTYAGILAGRAQMADPEDIPAFVTKALGSLDSKTGKLKGGLFSKTQTIDEARVFRTRLLEELAEARATPGSSGAKKKLLGDLQAAIIDKDMSVLSGQVDEETRAAIDLARGYSKDLNDRFTRGPLKNLLGVGRDRGVKTAEGLTLEVTVGRGGPVGREAADALRQAVEFSGDQPAMQAAIEDFLKGEFLRRATRDGKILKSQSESFMKQFDDVLGRYPELRQDFSAAIEADNVATLASRRLKGIVKGLDDPRISRAAVFIKAPVGRELDKIAASPHPRATMTELVRQLARRDPSGKALEGLKTGFGDWLLRNSQTGVTDAKGEFFVSGNRLVKLLESPRVRAMSEKLLTPGERSRLDRIARTAQRIEKAAAAKEAKEGILGDLPSGIVTLIGRIGGAQIGRVIARLTGGGTVQTPGFVSKAAKDALESGVQDPGKKLLIDAIGDADLFKALLTEATTPVKAAFVRKQLNAWLASVLQRELGQTVGPEGDIKSDQTNAGFAP